MPQHSSDDDSDLDEGIGRKSAVKSYQRRSMNAAQAKGGRTGNTAGGGMTSKYSFESADELDSEISNFGIKNQQQIAMEQQQQQQEKRVSLRQSITSYSGLTATTTKVPTVSDVESIEIAKKWLTSPCNINDPKMLCYVKREKSLLGGKVKYKCYLEGKEDSIPRYMMTANKKSGSSTSYYLFLCSDEADIDDRGSEAVIGKLRGLNAVGTKYIITDEGLSTEKTVVESMLLRELGFISFEFDGGPSKIEALIPTVNPINNKACVWKPGCSDSDQNRSVEDRKDDIDLTKLVNKQPQWDEKYGGHVLNFNGRVKVSSVKNFQLLMKSGKSPTRSAESQENQAKSDNDFNDITLQFGKVDKDRFSLDFQYPLSPFQAFALCIASMDGKIADRTGYEYVNKALRYIGVTGDSKAKAIVRADTK